MKALRKTPVQHPLKPVHQFQFALYFILVMLCILITVASVVWLAIHI